jgi:hypothetical protein
MERTAPGIALKKVNLSSALQIIHHLMHYDFYTKNCKFSEQDQAKIYLISFKTTFSNLSPRFEFIFLSYSVQWHYEKYSCPCNSMPDKNQLSVLKDYHTDTYQIK